MRRAPMRGDAELQIIADAAAPLEPERRVDFLHACAHVLASSLAAISAPAWFTG